jgi:hypothetical protein
MNSSVDKIRGIYDFYPLSEPVSTLVATPNHKRHLGGGIPEAPEMLIFPDSRLSTLRSRATAEDGRGRNA